MSLKVVGAGLGRTGTLSLKSALEHLLDAPCYHMMEIWEKPHHVATWHAAAKGENVDWDGLFQGYKAAVDWPACAHWRVLSEKYPEAIVLLSRRDPEAWWKSASNTIFPRIQSKKEGEGADWYQMVMDTFGSHFTTKVHDRDACIDAFNRHEAEVRASIPKDRLVVWEPGDDWGPLCSALDLPVPDIEYPRVNSTAEFLEKTAAHDAEAATQKNG